MAEKKNRVQVSTVVPTKVGTAIGTSILVSLALLSVLTVIQALIGLENDSQIVLNNLHLIR